MDVVGRILGSSHAYLLIQQIQARLHEEHQERQHFCEILDKSKKGYWLNLIFVFKELGWGTNQDICQDRLL